MDNYIKCLMDVNETAKESKIADFEFSEPREAIIFSQWMGAVLPTDERTRINCLPNELGSYLPSELGLHTSGEWYPLLLKSMVSFDANDLLERRYVRFVGLTKVIGQDVEFDQSAYSQEISNIVKEGFNPQSFILVNWNRKSHPKYDEPFWSYIAGCYLRKEEFLVTYWTPNEHVHGVPDMGAYKTPKVLKPLRKHKFVNGGCFLFELELPPIFGEATESPGVEETDCRSVVVEAKSRRPAEKDAIDQLISRGGKGGYLTGGCFDEGYVTGPDFDGGHRFGTISNTPDGQLLHDPCKRKNYSLSENKQRALNQIERLAKLVLAKNLSFDHLLELCGDKPYSEITFRGFLNELSIVLEHMTVDDVCSLVQEEGLNRFGYQDG